MEHATQVEALREFLLIRIADDEDDARVEREAGAPMDWRFAECEAKRSLISLHPEAVADHLRAGAEWAYDEMLRRLALPYADCPDYRQEWRP